MFGESDGDDGLTVIPQLPPDDLAVSVHVIGQFQHDPVVVGIFFGLVFGVSDIFVDPADENVVQFLRVDGDLISRRSQRVFHRVFFKERADDLGGGPVVFYTPEQGSERPVRFGPGGARREYRASLRDARRLKLSAFFRKGTELREDGADVLSDEPVHGVGIKPSRKGRRHGKSGADQSELVGQIHRRGEVRDVVREEQKLLRPQGE